MTIRSSQLYHYIRRHDYNPFEAEILRKPSLLGAIHKSNPILHYVLTEGSVAFILKSVEIFKQHKKEISFDGSLDTLSMFINRIRSEREDNTNIRSIMMHVFEIYHPDEVCEYLSQIVEKIETKACWIRLINMININGLRKLLSMDFRVPLPSCVVFYVQNQYSDLSCKERFLLASITQDSISLNNLTTSDLETLTSIDLYESFILFTLQEQRQEEWGRTESFKAVLYKKMMTSPLLKSTSCDKIRKFALLPETNIIYLNWIFDTDQENGIIYSEQEYIYASIKGKTAYTTRKYTNAWLKHYGCTSLGMMIDREILYDKLSIAYKGTELSYLHYDNDDELLATETLQCMYELVDVGVILLKGYIVNDELLRLLLLSNLVDLTVYYTSTKTLNKLTCYDENPFFRNHSHVNTLLILNQVSAYSMHITKPSRMNGCTVLQSFYNSPLQSMLPAHILEEFEAHHEKFLNRDFSAFENSRISMYNFMKMIVILFDRLPILLPGKFRSVRISWGHSKFGYDSRMIILKKFIHKGCDASFMGKLFSDYQSYYYATKLDCLPEIRNQIASYLDFNLILKSEAFKSHALLYSEYRKFIDYWSMST